MGKLKAKATGKKAEIEAKKAAAEARAAIADMSRASRDLAASLTESVRSSNLDQRALEIAERLRASDVFLRGGDLAAEMTATTQQRLRDARLDQRAAEIAERLRSSDVANRVKASDIANRVKTSDVTARAQRSSDDALARAGAWLATGRTGEKLGVVGKRRGVAGGLPGWLLAVLGVLVGYLVGTMTAPKRGEQLREEMVTGAQRLMQEAKESKESSPAAGGEKNLAEEIRSRIERDPRTSSLPRLNVNVAEGTAFIRGTVPAGFDESAVREIAAEVSGVEDVDLQVTVTA